MAPASTARSSAWRSCSPSRPIASVGSSIGTLLATALAVGLAELYSELVGARTRASLGGETEPLETVVGDVVAVGFGIAFPAVFFVAVMLA